MLSEKETLKANNHRRKRLQRLLELVDTLDGPIQFYALGWLEDTVRPLDDVLTNAESPIEQLLGMCLAQLPGAIMAAKPSIYCELQPQREVTLGGKTYRADFLLQMEIPLTRHSASVVIECDGHDFHERTKEQAQRDRARDRAMQAAGYVVMRFTGAEIWKDPNLCAIEVYTQALRLIERLEEVD